MDDRGYRPGHPEAGREALDSGTAAQPSWLACTPQTARTLVERGDIEGYWHKQRDGSCRFWLYRDSIEDFVAQFGSYPGARQRLRLRQSPNTSPLERSASNQDPRLGLRVLALQETVRAQDAVIRKLRSSIRQRDLADDYLQRAETARATAARLLGEALDTYQDLLAIEGMPDDPRSLLD